ncbi:glycosyltransferase [Chitinibacter fontanus]|uniref:Glycosyltransferase n=1 Tax=Chitinibacter fontanus TaxID=1737446 RepID=A0A7D5ZE39_9NEIS|nr:glycosyltransferase [Chitinibacter fontanus]QLI80129.1 glycosyltransferase [Chitinibacter fontanus]
MNVVVFKHSGNLGDVIYALPSIKKFCELNNVVAGLLLVVDAPMWLPDHLTHPSGNVMITDEGAKLLKPLLLAQEYIKNVTFHKYNSDAPHLFDVDLDRFRVIDKLNLAMGSIARYYQPILGFAPDLEFPWLSVEPKVHSDIVVARSSRYRNPNINYKFLSGKSVAFLGVPDEFDDFIKSVPDAKYMRFDDFYELACYVAGASLFIGNQTFIYSIAEALKINRILEPCLYAGNVIPSGGNNFEAFTQGSFEEAVESNFGVRVNAVSNIKIRDSIAAYQEWLAGFKVYKSHGRLIDQFLSSQKPFKSFVVFVFEYGRGRAAVEATIYSLKSQLLEPDDIYVFSEEYIGLPGVKEVNSQSIIAGISSAVRSLSDACWIYFASAGDTFESYALLQFKIKQFENKGAALIYSDEDVQLSTGSFYPALFPEFNIDWMRSRPYLVESFAIKKEVLVACFPDELFGCFFSLDLIFRVFEVYGSANIHRIPLVLRHALDPFRVKINVESNNREVLAAIIERHLSRSGIRAKLVRQQSSYRLLYDRDFSPIVSIIIPTKDQLEYLSRCVDSLISLTNYKRYEIIIVDNGSVTVECKKYLSGLCSLGVGFIKVINHPGEFNFSKMNNLAATQASGDYLLLLNNDTEIIDPDWLDAMLNHACRNEVGIVGAKLLFPDGTLQHAGVFLGLRGVADHPYIGMQPASSLMERDCIDQVLSAVTAACMMIRKEIYLEVGGFDEESLKVSFNDVDLCLKIKKLGYLIVWTPFAQLIHVGSVSQNSIESEKSAEKLIRYRSEQSVMYSRWLPLLADDPAFNPGLSRDGNGVELEDNKLLHWRPVGNRKRPFVLAHPSDFFGCGNYRVIKPLEAMESSLMVEAAISSEFFNPIDLQRVCPDIIVMQRRTDSNDIQRVLEYKKYSRSFKVLDLDDYVINLPLKSHHREVMPKDVLKSVRTILSNVDRFIVSTEELANFCSNWHNDIRIVRNLLPVTWWATLDSSINENKKIRIGWAGGVGHTGDLELIKDVIKHYSQKVEWVFLGFCPASLAPFVSEYHPGVSIETYPAKLASLRLDIAIAPLEENAFNSCKSNLKLLEYGACGFAVVCSDFGPYKDKNFPVLRVKNKYKDWCDALNTLIEDADARRKLGGALKAYVADHYMLGGDELRRWVSAWTEGA